MSDEMENDSNAKKAQPCAQDRLLTQFVLQKTDVDLYLVNGIKLQGQIVAYDRFVITLLARGQTQMVFKHTISTLRVKSEENRREFYTEATAPETKSPTILRKKSRRSREP
jgi:host factor-I protein